MQEDPKHYPEEQGTHQDADCNDLGFQLASGTIQYTRTALPNGRTRRWRGQTLQGTFQDHITDGHFLSLARTYEFLLQGLAEYKFRLHRNGGYLFVNLGVRDTQSIINLIMELLTEGFKDKFPFLYLYYIRIYAVEEALATPIESLNLTALPDPRELVVDALRDAERDSANFFKYLPFKNIELEKMYGKLAKVRVRNQAEVGKLIDAEKGLSLFNRLILKRALAPKAF